MGNAGVGGYCTEPGASQPETGERAGHFEEELSGDMPHPMTEESPARTSLEVRLQWWWLGGEQARPFSVAQWNLYDPQVQYHLTASYKSMKLEGHREGLVLDLSPFTFPPSPYQVWKKNPIEVMNRNAGGLFRNLAIAGYEKELWEVPLGSRPHAVKEGRIIAGFYQVHRDYIESLDSLMNLLSDSKSPAINFPTPPRRRVVLLVEYEMPNFLFGGVDRFRKKKVVAKPQRGLDDNVPPGEAVYQWWWGNPMTGVGHWKNYHMHVSAQLEKALAENARFANCEEAVPIDQVRYSLQRISRAKPFDYLDQNNTTHFREPFMPEHVLTVDDALFDEQTRLTNNCFAQFQNGNPRRRRPVRRIRRGEAAGLEMSNGDPCGVCFSNTGVLTGCPAGHVICSSCLRSALRIAVGDITQHDKLVCGCLTSSDKTAFESLAKRADATLQESLKNPPEAPGERQEFDVETSQLRRAFQLPEQIPEDIFFRKVNEWMELIIRRAKEQFYHACHHPGCVMENWILRADFDKQYRPRGMYQWVCKAGHTNSVLPSPEEINEMNRNILLHPEHYSDTCVVDGLRLRRFRLCPMCVKEGLLTFAVHEAGCKQWPGAGMGHRHCFCFHCTAEWLHTGKQAGPGQCNHLNQCKDPGIQQVRKAVDAEGNATLEIGFIDPKKYCDWVKSGSKCPPTIFQSGGSSMHGDVRQAQLGMEDRRELQKAMIEGTK